MNENDTKTRWYSTGFMGGGVASVDTEKHILHDAVIIQQGEAKGHDFWIDEDMVLSVVSDANTGKNAKEGLKARFGHPSMCSSAIGTFLGRWKNVRYDEGKAIGDLHLSSVASKSPKGDLRGYIEELAEKEPNHFGSSIVFTRDIGEENRFYDEYTDPEGSFISPDPANVKNYPHARLSKLHASDLVDDPAATDGMFSGLTGIALSAQVTEFLDLHPEILKALSADETIMDIIERYPEELKAFVNRYNANKMKGKDMTKDKVKTDELADKTNANNEELNTDANAESFETGKTAESETNENSEELEKENAEPDSTVEELAKNTELLTSITKERDELKSKCDELESANSELQNKLEAMQVERDSALARIKVIETGNEPLSTSQAEGNEKTGWQKAQKN